MFRKGSSPKRSKLNETFLHKLSLCIKYSILEKVTLQIYIYSNMARNVKQSLYYSFIPRRFLNRL